MLANYAFQALWNWSSRVKRKAREIYIHQRGTGGGLPLQKFLTELQEMLLQALGKLTVIGMPALELGLQDQVSKYLII